MGQTLAEKILASRSNSGPLTPGRLVNCRIDRVMATDITAPLTIEVFRKMGAERLFDPEACILVNDHFVPAKDIQSADFSKAMRLFAIEQGVSKYFEVGRSGICHGLVAERCLALPGQILLGADSHTCMAGALGCFATGVGSTDLAAAWALGELWFRVPESVKVNLTGDVKEPVCGKDIILKIVGEMGLEGARYMSVEFHGEAVAAMPMEDRFTLCNMAVEAGCKSAIIPPDDVALAYIAERSSEPFEAVYPDGDAVYSRFFDLDVSELHPQVAAPFAPCNVRDVAAFRDVKVDQVFIGSCTNGSLLDLRRAAAVLRGRRVAEGVRCIITPSTGEVFLKASEEGLLADFCRAGAAVTAPTCGACLGGHNGVLGKEEVAISTTNRNFVGRMGDPSSRVYLASPSVAAASAILGRIAHPEEV